MRVKQLLLIGGAVVGATTGASANGFQVYLGGQKNNGMGGVGVGLSLDQAAMFYNPGALAMVRSNGVTLGANATFARVAFRSDNGGPQRDLQPTVSTPFGAYVSFGPSEGKFKAGVAVYTPAASRLVYAEGWEGRAALKEIDLKAIYVQPTVSYAVTPQLSLGVGLTVLAYGSVNIQRAVILPSSNGAIELDGTTKTGFGVHAGLLFKPSDKFSLGLKYSSKIDATVEDGDGDVRLTNITSANGGTGTFNSRFTANKFGATIPLPATAAAGIGVMPSEKLTLGFDVVWTQWSAYKTLDIRFSGNAGLPGTDPAAPGVIGGLTTSSSKRDYQDALTFRLGGQYQAADKLTVRGGVAYDMTPVRDGYVTPETPDNDRLILTTGLTYAVSEKFGIDASYQFIHILQRTQTQADLVSNGTTDRVAGTYDTYINLPGLGVYYNF